MSPIPRRASSPRKHKPTTSGKGRLKGKSPAEILYGYPPDIAEELLATASETNTFLRELVRAVLELAGVGADVSAVLRQLRDAYPLDKQHAQLVLNGLLPDVRELLRIANHDKLPGANTLPRIALQAAISRIARRLGLDDE